MCPLQLGAATAQAPKLIEDRCPGDVIPQGTKIRLQSFARSLQEVQTQTICARVFSENQAAADLLKVQLTPSTFFFLQELEVPKAANGGYQQAAELGSVKFGLLEWPPDGFDDVSSMGF